MDYSPSETQSCILPTTMRPGKEKSDALVKHPLSVYYGDVLIEVNRCYYWRTPQLTCLRYLLLDKELEQHRHGRDFQAADRHARQLL